MRFATFTAAQIIRALPRTRISRAVGELCERPLHPRLAQVITRAYSRAYRVNLEEALPQPSPYPNFDAFFTRPLRTGARVVSADPLVSPADGRLSAMGRVDSGSRLFVKGQHYEIGELVGDAADAARYAGGQYGVVYLAPGDYHRVHAPVDGEVTVVRGIAGDLFPVNPIGERHVPQLFVRNQRVAVGLDTAEYGRVTVVLVGATIVGRITVSALPGLPAVPTGAHSIAPPLALRRGDELGVFHLGSTAVVLLEPGLVIRRSLGKIQYGESLLRPE